MLQQTQVNTVIPYYEKFMQSFPTIGELAEAEEDIVLHHWTGLGYYARARNLHKSAKIIHTEFNGELPTNVDGLCELPGIGLSTAGAIISLASKKRAVILDGNVKRVLCRYHCIEGWPDAPQTKKHLWEVADQHTPDHSCAEYTQAIMDLGATLCSRSKPACPLCPLQDKCQAYQENKTSEFPHKKPKKKIPVKATTMLMLQSIQTNKVLLEKRPAQGIWGGLWSFPEIYSTTQADAFLALHGIESSIKQEQWQNLRHTFSHYHLDITPLSISIEQEPNKIMENQRWHWYDPQNPTELGLPTPIKKLLAKLEQ